MLGTVGQRHNLEAQATGASQRSLLRAVVDPGSPPRRRSHGSHSRARGKIRCQTWRWPPGFSTRRNSIAAAQDRESAATRKSRTHDRNARPTKAGGSQSTVCQTTRHRVPCCGRLRSCGARCRSRSRGRWPTTWQVVRLVRFPVPQPTSSTVSSGFTPMASKPAANLWRSAVRQSHPSHLSAMESKYADREFSFIRSLLQSRTQHQACLRPSLATGGTTTTIKMSPGQPLANESPARNPAGRPMIRAKAVCHCEIEDPTDSRTGISTSHGLDTRPAPDHRRESTPP